MSVFALIPFNQIAGESRGFAFVTFSTIDEARKWLTAKQVEKLWEMNDNNDNDVLKYHTKLQFKLMMPKNFSFASKGEFSYLLRHKKDFQKFPKFVLKIISDSPGENVAKISKIVSLMDSFSLLSFSLRVF